MALAVSSFYGGQTCQQQRLDVESSEDNILDGGTAINNPISSLSHASHEPTSTSLVPLRSPSHNDSPVLQEYSSSPFAQYESSPGGQSPSGDERQEGTVAILKETKDVDVTPEVLPICGGGGGEKESGKPKEVRKLFPLFDMTTWTRQARQTSSASSQIGKENASSRKRRRSSSVQINDPVQELFIKRKKWVEGVPRAKGRGRVYCYLDFGQKTVGHISCAVCGMVYTHGLPEDEELHVKFHNSFVSGISFPGWKNERVVSTFADGRIVEVISSDPRAWTKKVCEVCKVVDAELGYADSVPVFRQGSKAYLFVSTCKRVIACVITDAVSVGYRMLPPDGGDGRGESEDVPWCCSIEPEQAALGINRLWVSSHYRRMGVATRMLDTIRECHHGRVIPRDLVAFSDPSLSGRKFAESYVGKKHFLVYQWLS